MGDLILLDLVQQLFLIDLIFNLLKLQVFQYNIVNNHNYLSTNDPI